MEESNDFVDISKDGEKDQKVQTAESDLKGFLKTDAPSALSNAATTTINPTTSAPDLWCNQCCRGCYCIPADGCGECTCTECCCCLPSDGCACDECSLLGDCCSGFCEAFSLGLEAIFNCFGAACECCCATLGS